MYGDVVFVIELHGIYTRLLLVQSVSFTSQVATTFLH